MSNFKLFLQNFFTVFAKYPNDIRMLSPNLSGKRIVDLS